MFLRKLLTRIQGEFLVWKQTHSREQNTQFTPDNAYVHDQSPPIPSNQEFRGSDVRSNTKARELEKEFDELLKRRSKNSLPENEDVSDKVHNPRSLG
ncbi:hypothetical protein [Desulfomonile tiedjei]|uniref:hypothetical protein n=1 Tax=Desulfomonile tiedjei TaxID=2358 RepID=UPI0012FBD746|nr:hypothetical protein [Desulfomonile tiedjei]